MKPSSSFVLSQQTQQLYKAAIPSNLMQLLVVITFYFLFKDGLSIPNFEAWLVSISSVLVLRLVMNRLFVCYEQHLSYRAWLNLYSVSSLMSGLGWTWFILFYLHIDDPQLRVLNAILAIGIMSAAISTLMSWKPAFHFNTIPQVISLIYVLYMGNDSYSNYLAIFFVLYYFNMLSMLTSLNDGFIKHLMLEGKNKNLVTKLNEEIEQRQNLIQTKTQALTDTNEQLKTSEARLNSIIDSSPVGIIYFDTDSNVLMINKRLEQIFNTDREKLINFNIADRLENERIKQEVEKALQGEIGVYHGEFKSELSGHRLFLHAEFVPIIAEQNLVIGGIGVFDDFTDKQQATETLTKLSRVVECSPHSVVITDVAGRIEYVNPTFSLMTGYHSKEVLGKRAIRYQFSSLPFDEYRELISSIQSGKEWSGVLEHTTKDGRLYWAQTYIAPISDDNGEVTHFVGIQEDVTDAKIASEKLNFQASHDELTGLINRYAFERKLKLAIDSAKHDNVKHALCFLDLDQFKIINDTCGHVAGDELLRQLGAGLSKHIRQSDTLARLGGDEFAILLEYCTAKQAQKMANSVREYIEKFKFAWQEHIFNIGVSIGVAEISKTTANATDALIHADSACYAAKDLGRNRVHFYAADDEQLAKRDGEFRWVQKINEGLSDDKFVLFAQPIVPVNVENKGKIFEVLVRYCDDNGELIPPGAFLASAERYNLSGKVDRWVVDNAIAWLTENRDKLDYLDHIAINLSGNSLGDDAILGHIIKEIQSSGVMPSKIKFEITETAAIANLIDAQMFISTLREFGCAFALDDFGSGLSSFGYLKNLPVDTLKIDGMFVKDIIDDEIDEAMVKSINEIGHVMGKKTVAEFVENQDIVDRLKELGVDYVQGYHIGKPEPLSGIDLAVVEKLA